MKLGSEAAYSQTRSWWPFRTSLCFQAVSRSFWHFRGLYPRFHEPV